MPLHNRHKILVVANGHEDPKKVRAMFDSNDGGNEILLARSHEGALELARTMHPELCILSNQMLMLHDQYFPDALKEACPEIDIFIADNEDLGVPDPAPSAQS